MEAIKLNVESCFVPPTVTISSTSIVTKQVKKKTGSSRIEATGAHDDSFRGIFVRKA